LRLLFIAIVSAANPALAGVPDDTSSGFAGDTSAGGTAETGTSGGDSGGLFDTSIGGDSGGDSGGSDTSGDSGHTDSDTDTDVSHSGIPGDTSDTDVSDTGPTQGPFTSGSTASELANESGGSPWTDGCGCSGAPGPAGALVAGLAGLALRRRSSRMATKAR